MIYHLGCRGQPSYDIPWEQVEFLLTLQIQLLGVSESTIRRRMRGEGISDRRLYSSVSDSQIDNLVSAVVEMHPHAGFRMVHSYLLAQGYRLTQCRVRASLERVDPAGIAVRWSRHRCIHQRMYYAPHPNAL